MRPPKTKQTAKREQQYRAQLKRCGFTSWKAANRRRCDLILDDVESEELKQLQELCRLYVKWKTNDELGRRLRSAQRVAKRYGIA